jgi:hypothetical protein
VAEFWIILLAAALVIAACWIYALDRARRKERRGRLAWKRRYHEVAARVLSWPDPEPDVSEEVDRG